MRALMTQLGRNPSEYRMAILVREDALNNIRLKMKMR